ncbi:MAG TPA: rhodanese-related sulfurtransferase [Candidatus Saccharimonadales bacterium]|nr:rhodanese-related sulfurtransferase [Candidatus Saccharimonadales bacterium]
MQKIIIYYKFAPLSDPEAIKLWQKALAENLQLRGRVLISQHGINGTLGGDMEALKAYIKATKQYELFKGTVFKWSDGTGDDFPKLSIKVRDEIVSFGAPGELEVDEGGVIGGGKHLKPEEVQQLVAERGEDVIFFDGRNAYEAAIGKFKNAVVPDTRTTKDFVKELESGKYNDIKDKPVVTYCTAGVRCEVLSALMKKRGFSEVYQMDGGIVKYGEKYKDEGLWEGSLYVFDGRMKLEFSENATTIGECIHCQNSTSNYENCALKSCNNLVLICEECRTDNDTCTAACAAQLASV